MIYCLTGKLLKKSLDSIVISCAGVGYFVQMPSSSAAALPGVGSETTVYTYLNITENDVSLFGFENDEQLACFKMLIGVSGVGPKAGLAILNVLTPDKVALAISSEDYKAFTAASGVGPKLAKRITLELKDKVAKGMVDGISLENVGSTAVSDAGNVSKAIAAMVTLGYSQSEAAAAISKLDGSLPTEELIRLALRGMAAGKR